MKLALIAGSAAAAMILLVQPAQALNTKVSGKYAFQEIDLCEAKLATTTATVLAPPAGSPTQQVVTKTVGLAQAGLIGSAIGYITFTPTSATSGNFSLTATVLEGGSLRVGNIGFTMNVHADAVTGTWSINSATDPTAVTITPTGNPAQTFSLRYADVSASAPTTGIARTFYLLRKDNGNGGTNTNCLVTINATRQTP